MEFRFYLGAERIRRHERKQDCFATAKDLGSDAFIDALGNTANEIGVLLDLGCNARGVVLHHEVAGVLQDDELRVRDPLVEPVRAPTGANSSLAPQMISVGTPSASSRPSEGSIFAKSPER